MKRGNRRMRRAIQSERLERFCWYAADHRRRWGRWNLDAWEALKRRAGL